MSSLLYLFQPTLSHPASILFLLSVYAGELLLLPTQLKHHLFWETSPNAKILFSVASTLALFFFSEL